jgi:SAM-dependent methyltransferase
VDGTRQVETLNTRDPKYTARLLAAQSAWWKRALDVQAPYRWNLQRLDPGFVLDVGCGLGRNLINLRNNGVGIDHNSDFVEIAKSRGLSAFTPEEFEASSFNVADSFDSILSAHVAEHMTLQEAVDLLSRYLYLLKPGGKVIVITPQEAGYRSDPTHIQFMDFEVLRRIASEAGLMPVKEFSFPFPRIFGRLFKHNEFVSVSEKMTPPLD